MAEKFRRNLTLGERAFVHMITSCIEVYKKESFGVLLGIKHKKHYMVVDGITFQKAVREYEYVAIKKRDVNRINYSLSHISDLKVIGDFHSHPDFPAHLSGFDREQFRKSGVPLSVIVLVKKTRKHRKWARNEDSSISGSLGKRYFIKIIAYEYDAREDKIHRIKIVCPYMRRLNKLKKFKLAPD